ncbi:hypothetical protein A1351_03990 [Methylosinus sp. R-45379]|uniref:hypothetical protein n=1 Tax=unclassified Methylosinus TaxID=2624500 RepID=UPI00047B0A0B|nr:MULTISPECIES: hypothetical protein [unclassified Methylosinus]OAI22660.1 hypothetical protein A1351_03990 [Methylosinus sp. R-45379]TDX66654.1 hypothetical protein EDE12_101187 [Methylosinus sp. sav-2]
MNLSEQPPVAEEASNGVEAVSLDAQLEAMTAERDRHAKDKIELITKASALSKELETARAELSAAAEEKAKAVAAAIAEHEGVVAHRDRLSAELDALRAELSAAHGAKEKAAVLAAQASAEIAHLKDRLAAAGSPDPLVVLADYAQEKLKLAVAWTRSKIPEGHAALPWFDRIVEGAATAGRLSAEFLRWLAPRLVEAYQWAKPRALELYAKAKSEIETRLKQS